MKIAFYKGAYGTTADKVICWTTLSSYSHCEIVFDDGVCASASYRDKGVRFKYIPLDHKWDVFELSIPACQEELARAFFNLHEGAPYDLLGALLSYPKLWPGSDRMFFCSEICGIVLGGLDGRSPKHLFNELRNKGML